MHRLSLRTAGPFRAIDCAAAPQSLLESELFGHVEGAFTGAVRDAPGHFRLLEALGLECPAGSRADQLDATSSFAKSR